MRFFRWLEPDAAGEPVERTITDEEILTQYYPWWHTEMVRIGKGHLVSNQNCVDDFCVVHWAYEVFPRVLTDEDV